MSKDKTLSNTEACVICVEHPLNHGKRLGVLRLNSVKSLNALTLDMIKLMQSQLQAWKNDNNILAIWLEGAGERALCAGGNVVDVYHHVLEGANNDISIEQYFTQEYSLDHLLHCYPKPIICWGSGIVMGGGMGLFMGADFRLVTESTKMAMPEITIGLFPDVGASYFLNKLEPAIARFIALTACHLNAEDALELKLANHFVPQSAKTTLLEILANHPWTQEACAKVKQQLSTLFTAIGKQPYDLLINGQPMVSNIKKHRTDIQTLMMGDIRTIYQAMQTLDTHALENKCYSIRKNA